MKTTRKIIVHIAISADGHIAGPDGEIAWLDRPRPKGNYGYLKVKLRVRRWPH